MCPTRIRDKRMLHLKTKTKRLTLVKSLLFALLLGAPLAASAQDVEINETNFPDENFRNYLLQQDYGEDGVLTEEEISNITYIDISKQNISNLTGIEYFTALEFLSCYGNLLTALDVSNNTALTGLDCYRNQLTTLDVSKNTALTYLNCNGNQLTVLDVSGCAALTTLYCHNNQIRGASMDALIAGLPENSTDKSYILHIYDSRGDGNVCTKTQVTAALTKGWTPYYTITGWSWEEYEGSDDEETGIAQPATATTDASAPVYTLSGQKVNNGSLKGKKGVYIIGGKKVVVK